LERTTPEFQGRVTRVSADLTKDQQANLAYYVARIGLTENEQQRPEIMRLVPGMPAEVHHAVGRAIEEEQRKAPRRTRTILDLNASGVLRNPPQTPDKV
jgi:hypothetical protein